MSAFAQKRTLETLLQLNPMPPFLENDGSTIFQITIQSCQLLLTTVR